MVPNALEFGEVDHILPYPGRTTLSTEMEKFATRLQAPGNVRFRQTHAPEAVTPPIDIYIVTRY